MSSGLGRGRGRGKLPMSIAEVGVAPSQPTSQPTLANDNEDSERSTKRLRRDSNSDVSTNNYSSHNSQYDDHDVGVYIPSYPQHHDDSNKHQLSSSSSSYNNSNSSSSSSNNNNEQDRALQDKSSRMQKLREEMKRKDLLEQGIDPEAEEKRLNHLANPPTPSSKPQQTDNGSDEYTDSEPEQEDDTAMLAMMGFTGFTTTKNQKVEDNHTSAAKGVASLAKGRTYRQYMNRKGGFNRALDNMK